LCIYFVDILIAKNNDVFPKESSFDHQSVSQSVSQSVIIALAGIVLAVDLP